MSDVVFMQKFFAGVFNHEHQQQFLGFGSRTANPNTVELSVREMLLYLESENQKTDELGDTEELFATLAADLIENIQKKVECGETVCDIQISYEAPVSSEEMGQDAKRGKKGGAKSRVSAKTETQTPAGKITKGRLIKADTGLKNSFVEAAKQMNLKVPKNVGTSFITAIAKDRLKPEVARNGVNHDQALERWFQNLNLNQKQAAQFFKLTLDSLDAQNVFQRKEEQDKVAVYRSFIEYLSDLCERHNSFKDDENGGTDIREELRNAYAKISVSDPDAAKELLSSPEISDFVADADKNTGGKLKFSNMASFMSKCLSAVGRFIQKHKVVIMVVVVLIMCALTWWLLTTYGTSMAIAKASQKTMSTALSVVPEYTKALAVYQPPEDLFKPKSMSTALSVVPEYTKALAVYQPPEELFKPKKSNGALDVFKKLGEALEPPEYLRGSIELFANNAQLIGNVTSVVSDPSGFALQKGIEYGVNYALEVASNTTGLTLETATATIAENFPVAAQGIMSGPMGTIVKGLGVSGSMLTGLVVRSFARRRLGINKISKGLT